jgi:hypothetical protein
LYLERILQLAREEDDEPCIPSTSHQPSTETAVLRAAIKRGKEFFIAVDVTLRPIAPFIRIRPKVPRVVRQKVIDKLTGEHLALESVLNTDNEALLSPASTAADAALVQRAIAAAVEQEADMYERCSSAQVYQNLASRCSALDWRKEVRTAAAAEKAYEALLAAQRVEEKRDLDKGKDEKERKKPRMIETKKETHYNPITTTTDPLTRSNNLKNTTKLIETDLNWDQANPDRSDDIKRRKLRRRVIQALENCPKWSLLTVDQKIETVERCTLKIIDTKRIEDTSLQRLAMEYIEFMIKKT